MVKRGIRGDSDIPPQATSLRHTIWQKFVNRKIFCEWCKNAKIGDDKAKTLG